MKTEKISDFIIAKRRWIVRIFLSILLISVIATQFVDVNYEISKYLPEESPSTVGFRLMESEFGYPGLARVMLENVSLYEAKLYKDEIQNVPGVDMIAWADSMTDIFSGFLDFDAISDYYKDGNSVMEVTFTHDNSSSLTYDALDKIKEIIGDKGHFSGPAVETKFLAENLKREILIIMLMAVILTLIILTITTQSWFEPIMFMTVMFIAMMISKGMNILVGEISFFTNNVGSIIQLAVAMDYSIFLLHTYTAKKKEIENKEKAMSAALRESAMSIISSGATTITGFIALALMQFSIGSELGIVLVKGVAISLITVLLFMPALILGWSGKIEKFKHRPFFPELGRFSKFVYKIRYFVLAILLIFLLPAYVGQTLNSFTFGASAFANSEGTEVYTDTKLIESAFGKSNMMLIITPNAGNIVERHFTDELGALPYVRNVTSLAALLPPGVPESFLPKNLVSLLHTEKFARILISVKSSVESDFSFKCYSEIQGIMHKFYPQGAYITGETPVTMDIKDVIVNDYYFVDKISLLGVALVILIAFRALSIPVIVIIPIQMAIFYNMCIPYLLGNKLMFLGYIIIGCLQLGATIDYSILMTNNYLMARNSLMSRKEAFLDTISKSALSIITSGSILASAGFVLNFVSNIKAISSLGELIGRGAVLSTIIVLVLLPTLLYLTDGIMLGEKRLIKRIFRKRGEKP